MFPLQSPFLTGQQCHRDEGPGRTWLCFRLDMVISVNKKKFSNHFSTRCDIGCSSCCFHQPREYLNISWEIPSLVGLSLCYCTHKIWEVHGPLAWARGSLVNKMQCPGRSRSLPGLGQRFGFSKEGLLGSDCGLGTACTVSAVSIPFPKHRVRFDSLLHSLLLSP